MAPNDTGSISTCPIIEAPVAIVTGAAAGLGRDIAERLHSEGYRIVASDISPRVHEAFGQAATAGTLVTIEADAGAADSGTALVNAALDAFGRIDAIVNNAGVGGPGSLLEDTAVADIEATFNVNVLGVIRLCQAAIPHLKSHGGGRIVNIGSLFATQPVVEGSAYCSSKAAVHVLSQCLALELGPFGITVNTVAPGFMLTAMHLDEVGLQADRLGISAEQRLEQLRQSVPVRRHGTGGDVAGSVLWLLSDDASYVTGQTIGVNGGIRLS
ncbi:SDR family NAD(P)-dependent oxidoreductase [Glaciibacter psychrotolerans]